MLNYFGCMRGTLAYCDSPTWGAAHTVVSTGDTWPLSSGKKTTRISKHCSKQLTAGMYGAHLQGPVLCHATPPGQNSEGHVCDSSHQGPVQRGLGRAPALPRGVSCYCCEKTMLSFPVLPSLKSLSGPMAARGCYLHHEPRWHLDCGDWLLVVRNHPALSSA